ncbi:MULTISPECIES: acyltransferase [unclassified Ruminococcus]|uniref:acyltransferase n=1 Tax=unclassified Ruminococcus TaxID=2608920 RepID=UPI00210C9D28|nr:MULTISPECIES: acyltransferase [unclassified Ruminococcus]MCQ4022191.1 acyltransferase family protein [Ruminococcus sp. zg-924]MCQ4115246.1 acyltransferase family protein [Ruminococcus sp. zg-921]
MSFFKQSTGKMRESGIELLRIILMFQVVFLHICCYGGYSDNLSDVGGIQRGLYWFMMFLSRTPVYVYIVILGYFSVSSNSNKTLKGVVPKIKKMYAPMLFFSLTIPAFMFITGFVQVTPQAVIKSFFPVLSRTWSFMTLYLIVILLSPFVNRCLNNISKREFMALLGILFFIFSVWTMLSSIKPISSVIRLDGVAETNGGKGLYGYLFMYILGAYIRLHIPKRSKADWRFIAAFVVLAVLNTLLVYCIPGYERPAMFNDNPISVIQGACLLLFFRDLKFKSRIVNHIALLNLGVYMIHEHPMVRSLIWDKLFAFTSDAEFYSSFPLYVFSALGVCAVIFISCAIIEQLRRGLFAIVPVAVNKLRTHIKNRT